MSNDQKLIKLNDFKNCLKKSLCGNRIFEFHCDVQDDKLGMYLKGINAYNPYYYETLLTFEQIIEKSYAFKACETLEEVQMHLLRIFTQPYTILKSLDNDTKIQISFKLWVFTRPIEVNFILDRKVKVDED